MQKTIRLDEGRLYTVISKDNELLMFIEDKTGKPALGIFLDITASSIVTRRKNLCRPTKWSVPKETVTVIASTLIWSKDKAEGFYDKRKKRT